MSDVQLVGIKALKQEYFTSNKARQAAYKSSSLRGLKIRSK